MTNLPLRLIAPATENRTVAMPVRKPNAELRTREHLTEAEVDALMEAARAIARVTATHHDPGCLSAMACACRELVDLRWDQIDFDHATLHVRRAKKGTPATHPIIGDEMRALRRLQREQDPKSPFVFTSSAARRSPRRLCPACGARWRGRRARLQGAPAHAAPRLRLRPGQQGPRYARPSGLPRPQEHSAHGALHRAGTDAV